MVKKRRRRVKKMEEEVGRGGIDRNEKKGSFEQKRLFKLYYDYVCANNERGARRQVEQRKDTHKGKILCEVT